MSPGFRINRSYFPLHKNTSQCIPKALSPIFGLISEPNYLLPKTYLIFHIVFRYLSANLGKMKNSSMILLFLLFSIASLLHHAKCRPQKIPGMNCCGKFDTTCCCSYNSKDVQISSRYTYNKNMNCLNCQLQYSFIWGSYMGWKC